MATEQSATQTTINAVSDKATALADYIGQLEALVVMLSSGPAQYKSMSEKQRASYLYCLADMAGQAHGLASEVASMAAELEVEV